MNARGSAVVARVETGTQKSEVPLWASAGVAFARTMPSTVSLLAMSEWNAVPIRWPAMIMPVPIMETHTPFRQVATQALVALEKHEEIDLTELVAETTRTLLFAWHFRFAAQVAVSDWYVRLGLEIERKPELANVPRMKCSGREFSYSGEGAFSGFDFYAERPLHVKLFCGALGEIHYEIPYAMR